MSNINIELAHTKIIKFSASVNIDQSTSIPLEAAYSAEVYEPKEPSDPTVMVLAKCSIHDSTSELLCVECTAELYYKFDPVPEDRAEAIRAISRDSIQNELNQRIRNLLQEMGQNLTVN